jgi:hypothetical protein
MANILFLFNLTDHAVTPWLDAGHTCLSVDQQHEYPYLPPRTEDGKHYRLNADIFNLKRALKHSRWQYPDFVIAFPDCTQLASSGAKHWASKRAADPEFQTRAVELAQVATGLRAPYVIENPKGALSTLWRKPDTRPYVHPWQFSGYLPEGDVHPDYPEYIANRDAYPKETGLWVGNGAQLPVPKPVAIPEGYSTQFKKLGGKSLKTKNIRSATPRGMFIAVYEANKHLVGDS